MNVNVCLAIGGSPARHKGCPRDHTHGHGVRLAEIDTLLLQLQDVGRPHVHIVVFKVSPSGVIDHNEHDVGSLAAQGAAEARPQEEGKQEVPLSWTRHGAGGPDQKSNVVISSRIIAWVRYVKCTNQQHTCFFFKVVICTHIN